MPHALIGTYGSGVNGLVTSLTQFVSYVQLVEAGISSAAVFQLYAPLAQGDAEGASRVVSAARVFYYKSGAAFTALMLALACLYPVFVQVEGVSTPGVFVLVLALGATGFLDFFTLAKYRVLLTATQRNWVIQLASIAYKALYVAVVLVGTFTGVSVVALFVIAVLPIIVRTAILIVYAKRNYPEIDFNTDAKGLKLDQRWDAFFLQVLGAVQSGAPTIIATFVLGDLSLVSVFSVYMLVANGLQNAVNSLSQGTQASFGDVIARGESETLKRSFREFQALTYGVTGVACGVGIALIVPFVRLYTADIADVDYAYPLVGILCMANVLLYHLKTPQGLLVIAAGKYRDTRLQTSLQTVILLVGSIVLGAAFGMPGILSGMIFSNLYRDIDLMFYVPREVTKTEPMETLKFMLLAVAVCALVSVPYLAAQPLCTGWAAWALSTFVLALWGCLLTLALYRAFAREQLAGLLFRAKRLVGAR
ncbi:hypothetical protein [Collinsella sp. An271]|uniref:hypothetical protein n=1 Tax=Collinsella sp. An271 TaxID=1965616 RepID=UPI00117D0428|nr:hypothetical protein [Collinsella sp. An271]